MDATLLEIFSTRLRETRGDMMQVTFAKKIGVSRASLSSYENGTRIPDIETLKRIYEETGISIYYLLGLTDSKDDALADSVQQTGLSSDAIKALTEKTSVQYAINRILTNSQLHPLIAACLIHQGMLVHNMTSEEPTEYAIRLENVKFSSILRDIFTPASEADTPPDSYIDELTPPELSDHDSQRAEVKRLLQRMSDEQYDEALIFLRNLAEQQEAINGKETPES